MKEFMLRILNDGDTKAAMSPEQHKAFVTACERYIDALREKGQLIAAQPLVREGTIISGRPGEWKEEPFSAGRGIQVGYYHIRANDMDEAITIAKGNPEFEYGSAASIEVRPIKTKESVTGFVYPKQG